MPDELGGRKLITRWSENVKEGGGSDETCGDWDITVAVKASIVGRQR